MDSSQEHRGSPELFGLIRQMAERGERTAALEALEPYLNDFPAHIDAVLLKAILSLDLDRNLEFVANLLNDLTDDTQQVAAYAGTINALRTRVEGIIQRKLAEARTKLRSRESAEAVTLFQEAIDLAGMDAAIPLAAATALISAEEEFRRPTAAGGRNTPFGSSLRANEPPDTAAAQTQRAESIERFLRLACRLSDPNSTIFTKSAVSLAKFWLNRNKIGIALDFLSGLRIKSTPVATIAREIVLKARDQALDAVANFIRADQPESVSQTLQFCSEIDPDHPSLLLLWAELHRDQPQEALRQYRAIIDQTTTSAQHITIDLGKSAWASIHAVKINCPQCTKQTEATSNLCVYCGSSLRQKPLLSDRYSSPEVTPTLLAHLGAAEMLAKIDGGVVEAISLVDKVISRLDPSKEQNPFSPSGRIHALRRDLGIQFSNGLNIANPVPSASTTASPQPPNLPEEEMLNTPRKSRNKKDVSADGTLASSIATDTRAIRALIKSDSLDEARQAIDQFLLNHPDSKAIASFETSLERAKQKSLATALKQMHKAFNDGKYDLTIQFAEQAIRHDSDNCVARLCRAQAYIENGHELLALEDFRAVLEISVDEVEVEQAKIGIAQVLELRREYTGALAALKNLQTEAAKTIRGRLERRLRGEPTIHVSAAQSLIQQDSLERDPSVLIRHAYFTVAIRSVGRPWNVSMQAWVEKINVALLEFLQALGGLRNGSGEPVFAIRMIAHPHEQIPERGKLTIGIIARVSAETAQLARHLSVDLWTQLRTMLPLVQDTVYVFDPVVDDAELDQFLRPFAMEQIAELVRREAAATDDGKRYAIYGLTNGTPDLHNVCWALLRQNAPSMISIHLMPTHVMSWEASVLTQHMLSDENPFVDTFGRMNEAMPTDPIANWWQSVPRWGRAQSNRTIFDLIEQRAFILRVMVASSAKDNPLIAEVTGSALFGPLRRVEEAVIGGFEVIRAETEDEIQVAERNITLVEVERWGFTAAPDGLYRLRHLFGEAEAMVAFRLPVPHPNGVPGIPLIDVKPIAPPADLPVQGTTLGESVTRVNGMPLRIIQSIDDRRRHAYVVGKTGVGKSTLLRNMALQDIEAGQGVCVVDPHGDLIEDLLVRIPEHRVNDVILFDPSDEERPIGLNLLEHQNEMERHRIVTEFIGLLIRMYDPHQQGIVGPRFQHNVRNAMLTVMATEGSTLIEVVRALSDPSYVRSILHHVSDPMVRNYWDKQVANTSDFHKSEILDYIVSKFSRFVGDKLVRNIVGQKKTTLNFRNIMDERKILLVNLSKGKIGPENAQFLGLLLVQRLLLTALSRANVMASKRPDYFLYVDEFQNFATDLFGTVLSEGRKYGLAVTVANQYLTQLDGNIREAIFGNVGSIISFRLGTQDAQALAPEMYPVFGVEDMLNLPKYTACIKMLVDGVAARPFTMRTVLDTRAINTKRAEEIRAASRQQYGRDVKAVNEDMLQRFKTD